MTPTRCPAVLQGRLDAAWLDQDDCVGAWQSDSLAAVVLPTANTLDQVRAAVERVCV